MFRTDKHQIRFYWMSNHLQWLSSATEWCSETCRPAVLSSKCYHRHITVSWRSVSENKTIRRKRNINSSLTCSKFKGFEGFWGGERGGFGKSKWCLCREVLLCLVVFLFLNLFHFVVVLFSFSSKRAFKITSFLSNLLSHSKCSSLIPLYKFLPKSKK